MKFLRLTLGLTFLAFPFLLGAVAVFTNNDFLSLLFALSLYLLSLWGDLHTSKIVIFDETAIVEP